MRSRDNLDRLLEVETYVSFAKGALLLAGVIGGCKNDAIKNFSSKSEVFGTVIVKKSWRLISLSLSRSAYGGFFILGVAVIY